MPDIGLPTGANRAPKGPPGARGGRGFKRGGGCGNSQFVAHELGGVKERTEDVVTGESRKKTFPDLLLSQPVLRGLHTAGFVQPSPVQLLAIPPAKVGFDLIVQSKSGTGKTCVYVVAALEMLKPDLQGLQALVLAPTREIAIQGVTVAMQIGQELGKVKMAAFIGGISLAEDKVKAKTCQLGVGTPGRLKQLITEGILNVDSVRLMVLDEADKLLEPAFLADTTAILNMLPKSKQVLALSATYPDQLASLAERFMRSPQHIRPGQSSQVLTGVAQFLYTVQHCQAPARQTSIKQAALLSFLSSVPYTQCLVFSNYSTIAQATSDFLNSRGFPAIFISAGQDQSRRLAAMQTFKQFNCRILCSTDLTARGIDAENVNLVINLEVPWEQNTYLHRIGRGGRFGSLSLAVTLASEGVEVGRMRGVVKKTGSVVKILPVELPRDVRGEMEGMEVLEAAQDAGQDDDQSDEVSVDYTDDRENDKQKDGKIKRRGKRKVNGETIMETSLDKDIHKIGTKTNDKHVNKSNAQDVDAKDREDVNKFMSEQNSGKSKAKLPSFEEITELANKIDGGEVVTNTVDDQEVPDMKMMEKVGQAVGRISSRRREDYNSRLEEMKMMMKGKEVGFLLEKLSVGDVEDLEENVRNIQPACPAVEESDTTRSDSNDTSDSESSSSESGSSSSSDSDSDSDSSSSSESDQQASQPKAAQFPGYPSYPSYPGYPAYPQQPAYPPLPAAHPPPPGHPLAHAWYTQWAATVAQQRQAVQQMEYNKYIQYLQFNQEKK